MSEPASPRIIDRLESPRGPADDADLVRGLHESPDRDHLLAELPLAGVRALAERVLARLGDGSASAPDERHLAWDLLDLLRRPPLQRRLAASDLPGWTGRILDLIERSHLTVGPLVLRRAASYGSKVLFELPGGRTLTWRQTAARVEGLARGLLALHADSPAARVAILAENRVEVALVDLACLACGIVDVMVPANASEADVGVMLAHSGVETVIVGGADPRRRLLARRESLPALRRIVALDPQEDDARGILSLDAVAALAEKVPAAEVTRRAEAARIGDLATIMYTSGTTGVPKAIQFTHRNLVTKRFMRALALPEIGESDVFLCYLPLYHTFGRFLEMLGCVFWGATYAFLDSPSVEAMVEGMRRVRPTVFISVPKKWIQLHGAIARRADVDEADDEEIARAVAQVTGGRLRWGLSAAGHLDPEIFRFFQRYGVELMSGFGMTEATGGITMTPPGQYADGSLGVPLPGIDVRLAPDGELCVRGPYVMAGYLDPIDGEASFDEEGWFHSGDLMERDARGHLRLVDRKKEIYKNIKGETIAPQRIENLFRDFESIARVFLVGDHREYNTALIHPNPAYGDVDLAAMSPEERKAHFRSLVVSVNKFLAPYERIVDFTIIDRDLEADRGELTVKGTVRRSVVERNFADTIRLLYRRTHLSLGGAEVVFPNWLFQALGLTAESLDVGEERLALPATGAVLAVRSAGGGLTQVGSCVYATPPEPLNLGAVLTTPSLWLGNEDLVGFAPLQVSQRERPGRMAEGVEWRGRVAPYVPRAGDRGALEQARRGPRLDLMDLHVAACAMGAEDEDTAVAAVLALERALEQEDSPLAEPARFVLARAATSPSEAVRRRALVALVRSERDTRFPAVLDRFLAGPGLVLDGATRSAICELDLSEGRLAAFLDAARAACLSAAEDPGKDARAAALLAFLAEYGSLHPTRFRRLRAFLVRQQLDAEHDVVRGEARRAAEALQEGFRAWLGPALRIAVDAETSREYRWDDVVVFEDRIDEDHRQRILSVLRSSPFVREATFLFAGTTVRLSDIPPGGVWVRFVARHDGKAVYRLTVQTRFQGAFDFSAVINDGLTPAQVRQEMEWLIVCGELGAREPLVHDVGGHWEREDVWSEEHASGETLDHAMRRLARRSADQERVRLVWPFLSLRALTAYVDVWDRTGRRWELADPGPGNVVVPTHDYHTGARIVSITARRPHAGLLPMLFRLQESFVTSIETQYPFLAGMAGWETLFSALLEVVGEEEGLRMLHGLLAELRAASLVPPASSELSLSLQAFLRKIEVRGFLPMRLFFAVKRYRRWAELNPDATPAARARTLHELEDTYGLQRLGAAHPEWRVRFFRETVFHGAPAALLEGLESMIARLRTGALLPEQVTDAVADLRAGLDPGEEDDYFLTRLSFPHLRPEDSAGFVQAELGGRHGSEIVVTLEDAEGQPYQVRHALTPKEVGRLHRLFLNARLDVRFRPEHQYLVALNDRGHILGGIYYEVEPGGRSAHLEKIVVAERFRKKGVADGLMNEFLARLRTAGVTTVTTGFFRPEYFYAYGFAIEKRYAGLVKELT